MAWHSYGGPLVPFSPHFNAPPMCNSPLYRTYPDWQQSFYHGNLYGDIDGEQKALAALYDRKLEQMGDLGWSVDYATAWCYRHLVSRGPEVADAIDNIRDMHDIVNGQTPYFVFDYLDKALFAGKLRTMVHLRWKHHPSSGPGITFAPKAADEIPRITIELNSTLFEDCDADIDELLEALIHQMIHAFFLVCCGVQKKGEAEDGRLEDGVHFGVVLLTIKEITKQCADGPLRLIFHACKRKDLEGYPVSMDGVWPYEWDMMRGGDSGMLQPYIMATSVGSAPADNQTHCMHDNRHITFREIKDWQVKKYSAAIEADMESKGEKIWDFDEKHELKDYDRRFIDKPSSSYIELVWDEKRVMANREKALAFKSLKKPLEKDKKYELEMPDCEEDIFKSVYDYINRKAYCRESDVGEELARVRRMARRKLGPVLVEPLRLRRSHVRPGIELPSIKRHIQVFKAAEQLKFEELQKYALERLYELETTDDDPIESLRLLYGDKHGEFEGSVHSELHVWARRFLARQDEHNLEFNPLGSMWCHAGAAPSNLAKLMEWYADGLEELLHKSQKFREDFLVVRAQLVSGLSSDSVSFNSPSANGLLAPQLMAGGLGRGLCSPLARPLLTSSLSDSITDQISDALEDRLLDNVGLNPGLGLANGLAGGNGLLGGGNGLLGLPGLRRASAADLLGADLLGMPRAGNIFDHLPAI